MAEYLFEQDQLDQMDNNIRDMLSKGATQEDVMMYANDYKEKFVKKKDGTTAPLSSPSVSGGVNIDPPTVTSLLKKRNNLIKSREVPEIGPDGTDLSGEKNKSIDLQLSEIDSQIKSRGYDPEVLSAKWTADVDLSDTEFKRWYDNKDTKPLSTKRQIDAFTWHNAVRSVINQEDNEEVKKRKNDELNLLISTGAKLPNTFQDAITYGKNAYNKIIELTVGDAEARKKAIDKFKADFTPVFGEIFLRDKNASKNFYDIPAQLANELDKIFNPQMAQQTERLWDTKFTSKPAREQKDRRLGILESSGLNVINDGINQIYENNLEDIKRLQTWNEENQPRIEELKKKIDTSNITKAELDKYSQLVTENNNYVSQLNKFDADNETRRKDLESKDNLSQVEYDELQGIYDGRSILISELNEWKSKNQAQMDSITARAGLRSQDIDEYNRLITEADQFNGVANLANNLMGWSRFVENRNKTQFERFPTLKEDLIRQAQQEYDGPNVNKFTKTVVGVGKLGDKIGQAADVLYTSLFGTDDELLEVEFENLGMSKSSDLSFSYERDKESLIEKPVIWAFTNAAKKQLSDIDANANLSEDEKRKAKYETFSRLIEDGGIYKASNPKAGDFNFTVNSVLNTVATVAPDLIVSLGSGLATGGSTTAMSLSVLMNTWSDYYNEAVEKGYSNPMQYATIHSTIEALVERVGTTDLKMLKGSLKDSKGFAANYIKNLSQADFDKLMAGNRNVFRNYAKGLGQAGRSNLEEGLLEEVILSNTAGNFVNNKLYGEDVDLTEGALETFTTMSIGMLPLNILGIPISVNKANIGNKLALYSASTNVNKTLSELKALLDSGDITQKEYDDRAKLVNDYSIAIKQTPQAYANGEVMRDDDRVKYAFNQFIINKKNSSKDVLTGDQKKKVEEVVNKVEAENNSIYNRDSELPKGQQEVVEADALQGDNKANELSNIETKPSDEQKKETIKQKFDFITDQDFVSESFTPEEDAADRAALPESDFKSEEELSDFLANGEYAMLTGQNPDAVALSKTANKKLNDRATQWLADRGLKATPIFGKYDNSERSFLVPNMTKAQAIEFAKEFQQDSVAHSSGLVYKDGSFNPREEGVNLEPRFDQGGNMFSSINIGGKPIDFSIKYDFNTTVPAEGMQVDEQGQLIDTKLQDAIGKASQALEKSGIKFNIIDTSVNPEQADAARGNQAIFRDTDGTITIDKSKLANDIEAGIVVWHESSHPVMNIIRNTDRNLYDAVVRGLTSAAQKNEGIQKALDWATDGYEGNDVQADEALVETIARIAEGVVDITTLDTGLRQRIIDFINDIAKFFGINPIIDNTDLAEFKRVATQVADALSQGRDIAEIVGEENVRRFENALGTLEQAKIDERLSEPGIEVPRKEKLPLNITPNNEADVMNAINRLLDKYPNALTDRNQWKELMSRVFSYTGENGEVLIPAFPEGLSRMASSVDQVIKELNKVSTEQRQLASEGISGTKEIGKLYKEGKMDEVDTGLYFLWNIMSIGISPYPQESGFLQAVDAGVDKYIKAAAEGKFDGDVLKEYLNWVNTALPTGTPGAGAKANLNSFGKSFLSKASQLITEGEFAGKTRLEALHSILADRTTPTNKLRRKWQANMGGMQFNNKIFDFILLTTGRSDLFVIDRVRVDHFWDGDKFKEKVGLKPDTTLYNGAELKYKATEGAGFSRMLSDVPGLVFAELANRSMKDVVEMAYKKIGVKDSPEVGRFHWETWVAASAQEVSHGSIDAIVQRKDGGKIKNAGVRQGKYGAWDFNFTYRKVGDQPFRYEFTDNAGNVYIFDDIRFVKDEIDNQANKNYGKEETRFLIKDAKGNVTKRPASGISKAWYDQPGIDSQKYFDFLRGKAKEVIPAPDVVEDQGVIIDRRQPSVGNRGDLIEEAGLRKKMTEDGEGNYVFFHYSYKEFRKVDPSKFGSSNITGRDERPGVDIAMFYTDPDTNEVSNSKFGYSVRIPKDKVYPFNKDPLNLLPEARRAFEKQYPGQAFDANKQAAFVTKIASDRGYPMTVVRWKIGNEIKLRAQTTEKLPVKLYEINDPYDGVITKEEFTANSKKRGQFSVGGRSEEELRAEGQGKERNRALASKYGDLSPETQTKIEDDAVTYFQRPNKQTEKAVDEFLDGINLIDAADYVLGNPDIPEVSKVWMAATVAKRLNAEIDAAKTDNNQDLVDALTSKQAEIYNEFAKKATSLGQAVQAFIAFKNDPNAVEFFLPKILRQLKKAGVEEVTEVQKADIIQGLKNVNEAKPGLPKDKAIIELSHYLAGIAPMKPVDILQALWYAKILSGVTTQATNFFANVFNTLFELPAVGMRIAIKSGDPLAVIYGIKGFGSGVVKGAVSAADIIKTGVRSKEIDKYFSENPLEYFTWSKWLGEKGKVLDKIPPVNFGAWKYIGRILAATDAMFSTANQEAVANMLAYAEAEGNPSRSKFRQVNEKLNNISEKALAAKKQAIREGFKRDSLQWKRRVIELIDQGRDAKVMEEADAIGKRITMNYDPEGWTRPIFDAVVGLQRNIPIIKMVVPFARIVANLTENALNYTPAGAVRAAIGKRSPFSKSGAPLTTDERIDLMSKFAIGMGALAILATKVGDDDDDWFDITAGGPNDTQKKYELQKGGWRPYTIVFKDGARLNYKDWPIAGILAGMGNIRDSKKYGEADETSMALAAYGFFLNFYDKSLLSGLSDFFGIFNVNAGRGKYAPETKASERATKWAAQQAKSVAVSNLAQQTGKLYSELITGDPQRDAKTFTEIIYRDLPMFNDGIRPIIDVFGDEVKYTTTERLFPLMDDPEKDSIIKWLNENKLFVGVPKKTNIYEFDTDTERPMTDEEYYEYRKLAGKKTKEWILDFMEDMKGDERQVTEGMFDAAKRAARSEAYAELFVK